MTDPVWPSSVTNQRILQNTRKDRPDGYDFVTVMGIEAENGVEVRWRTDGSVQTFAWGERHRMVQSIENVPPHMDMATIPSVITRTLRETGSGRKRRVQIEEETKFADGHTEKEKYKVAIDRPLSELTSVDNETVTATLKEVHEQGLPTRDEIRPGKLVLTESEGER